MMAAASKLHKLLSEFRAKPAVARTAPLCLLYYIQNAHKTITTSVLAPHVMTTFHFSRSTRIMHMAPNEGAYF